MNVGEITDMDIVSNSCAVRSGIVVSKDLDGWFPAEYRIKRKWKQMRLNFPRLADFTLGVSASCVEVPQARITKTIGHLVVVQDALRHQFRGAVRINRLRDRVLSDRNCPWLPVHRAA